jgi:glycogen(starch) synthase
VTRRVLFASEFFWPYVGGAERLAAALLPALRERGYEFLIVTSHDYLDLPDEGSFEGIPLHRIAFRPALASRDLDRVVEASRQLARLKAAFRPDLVHLNSVGPCDLFHLETARRDRAPVLVTMQQRLSASHVAAGTAPGRTLRAADWVVGCSAAMLAEIRALVPEITPRSSVVYNGVGIPSVSPEPLSWDPPRLVCLGRLLNFKGFDLAIRAFATLVERFPTARLAIGGDGPERSMLERQVREFNLGGRVEFLGWIPPDGVPALLNTASLVVLPSRWEGLPFVAIESALMARPVVATRVGGLPECVVHGETGLLVEAEDATALAEAIGRALADPELSRRLGQAARERARERFSLGQCASGYDAVYQAVASGTTAAG